MVSKASFGSLLLLVALSCYGLRGEEPSLHVSFRENAKEFISRYCVDCHGERVQEGKVRLDLPAENSSSAEESLLKDKQLWWRILKNVRAELMPPAKETLPADAERARLVRWIETEVFDVDPNNPDPGPATLRRLNRTEYRQTINDLMGIDFNAEIVFPPDDTGFGFDNIGDALSISPMLLEKYLQAATAIVDEAVPTETWIKPTRRISGSQFRNESGLNAERLRHDQPTTVAYRFDAEHAGKYRVEVRERLHGSFNFHPGRYSIDFSIDNQPLYRGEYKWEERKEIPHSFDLDWQAGQHDFSLTLKTLSSEQEDKADSSPSNEDRNVQYQLLDVTIIGPLDQDFREHPAGYTRFFTRDEPPTSEDDQRKYAEEILQRFATRAFRQKVSSSTVERLVSIALSHKRESGSTFEAGIAKAMVAALASPKFLFKHESPDPQQLASITDAAGSAVNRPKRFVAIDEFSLASRLSYFLWSSMPDDELTQLAAAGKLRSQLDQQLARMLKDDRSREFTRNFVGQWLRARDVEHVSIDPIAALGHGPEFAELAKKLADRFGRRRGGPPPDPETAKALARFRELLNMRDKLSSTVRSAMRRETEMAFETIVREDRSLLELLDASYVFVNSDLAELYGITGVRGKEMQRVELPEGSPRGGVLTQGTMLLVTSNPTRTSQSNAVVHSG